MKRIALIICILLLMPNMSVFADGAGGYFLIGDNSKEVLFTGSAADHYLILSDSGVVSSFGKNECGQCGDSPCDTVENVNYISFDTESKIVDVKAGKDFSLALDESGTAWGWGNNISYQLGIPRPTDTTGTPTYFVSPQKILSDISAIEAGDNFSAFLSKSGTVYVSGRNQVKKKVFGDEKIKSISAKAGKLLALNSDNVLLIWDYNTGNVVDDVSLVGKDIIAFETGAKHLVYILNEEDSAQVYVYGDNSHYQLGIDDSSAEYSEPVCVLTIPDIEDKTISLKVGNYSTFIDVFDELSSNGQIDEYCFGTGCYYISEDYDDYSFYSDGFDEEVVKTPTLRSVSHQIIAVGNDKSIAYRIDDAIEVFGNNEKPTVVPIIEPDFPAETMYEYQYEDIDYQTYDVNFIKINKENFDKYSEGYAYWEYVDEHSFNVKIKNFMGDLDRSNWNPKFGIIRLCKDVTNENRDVGTIGQKLWNFYNYGVRFRTEQQEIAHGNEDGNIIHVSAQLYLVSAPPRQFNIPADVKIFYEKPGVITESTKLGLYLYDLPYGTEGIIENISGNTFDIRLNGNSTADLDYDLPVKLCYIYSNGASQHETIGEYDLNETKVNAVYANINNVIIKSYQNTPEKMTISAELTSGRENGASISVSIDGGTFAPILKAENWQIIGNDGLSVEEINRIDDNNAELIVKGNSTDKYTSSDIQIKCAAEEYCDSREYDEDTYNYYDVPLVSENSITIQKQTRSSGGGGSSSKSVIAKPSASIASGEVVSGTQIRLSSDVSDAKIYYTTDGSTPTADSTLYTAPITVTNDVVIKFMAVSGKKQSQVQSVSYTVKTPSVSLKKNSDDMKYIDVLQEDFDPDAVMTRYEILSALNELFDIEDVNVESGFTDVDAEHKKTVDLFVGAKLIDGYPDNTFKGSEGITRAEFVKILCDMLKPDKDGTEYFSDISGHWAKNYINSFYKLNLVRGYPDGTFKPNKIITKEEAITVLNRVAGINATTNNNDILPSIQVTGSYWFPMSQQVNYITPENGVDLETAKNLMTEELSKTEANTWSVDDLKEITVDEFWKNTNAQMFISEDSGYVGIIKNGSVICATGGGTMAVFISDINSDGVYDVCISSTFRFGDVDFLINVFDVNDCTYYTLWNRMDAVYWLRIDEDTKELKLYKNEVMIGNLTVADGKLAATEEWRYEENDPGKPVFPRTDEIHKNKLVVDIVDNSIVILLNGKTVEFTDALPFIDDNSRTQIPVRAISELMGYDVDWNGEKQTVTIKSETGNIIKLEIGSDVMKVNGEEVHMDTSAIIKDNRTYIPVRFIAEAIGYEVNWIC